MARTMYSSPMPKKSYEAFIYDWDGTLAKTLPVWVGAYAGLLETYGKKPPVREIVDHLGDKQFAKRFDIPEVEEFADKVALTAHAGLKKIELYEGAIDILHTTKSLGLLALTSNSPRDTLEHGLRYAGVEDCFDVVYGVEDVTFQKPHQEVILKALDRLRVPPEKAVIIGESHKDMQAGINAGIDTMLVAHAGHEDYYDLPYLVERFQPTHVVSDFAQAEKILLDQAG